MSAWISMPFHRLLAAVTLSLAVAVVWPVESASGQPLFEGGLACPPGSPPGGTVLQTLLTELTSPHLGDPLNSAWATKAPDSIDPYPRADQPALEIDQIPIDCTSSAQDYCEFYDGDSCSSMHANVTLHALSGLSQLRFEPLTVTTVNLKEVAAHANRGPDASKITDGVFGPEGADWNDPYFTVILGWQGAAHALTIDLGASTTIDGTKITVQADRHAFQLDYYNATAAKWIAYGSVPAVSSSGLHTRTLVPATGSPTTFMTSSIRLWPSPPSDNDYNFSISEVQLHDSPGGHIVSTGKPADGPRPYQLTDGLAPEGQSATDAQYAVVLNHETGAAPALAIDLGTATPICGNGYDCLSEPVIQADNDDVYGFDYSVDGKNWITYGGTFPSVSGSGLHKRNMQCSARPDPTMACSATNHGPSFTARFVRVYALSGGNTFAVSELQLWDTSSRLVSAGKPAYGPEPMATNGQFAPEGADWNDSHYATILPPCSTSASNAKSTCPPASSPPTSPALTGALVIDLNETFPVDHLQIQADRHQFQVDSSLDGQSWAPLWTVPAVSGSGLRTRTPTPSDGSSTQTQARYLRVYGTAGDDNNYSVSELQVFTPQANTACAYDGGANIGENFACSYDGGFDPGIVLPDDSNTTLTVHFYLDSAAIKVTCVHTVQGGDKVYSTYTLSDAHNRNCTDTLQLASPPPASPTPAANLCAGSCASSAEGSFLSYAQLADDQPEFTTATLTCDGGSIDTGIIPLLEGLVPSIAAEATRGLFNGILDYHNKYITPPISYLVPFPPNPGMCSVTASEPTPLVSPTAAATPTAPRAPSGDESGCSMAPAPHTDTVGSLLWFGLVPLLWRARRLG